MNAYLRPAALAAAYLLGTSCLCAGPKLFEVTATTTDNRPPLVVTAASSNFLDFVQQVVNQEAQFAQLGMRDYNASFRFLGVANAIQLAENALGTSVTLDFTPIGVRRTFTGATEDDVYDQIEDFFLSDGADIVARFWKAISEQSAVAVNDGNPQSATASGAAAVFMAEGFTSAAELGLDTGEDASGGGGRPRFSGLGLGFNSGRFEAGPFTGSFYDFSASKSLFKVVNFSAAASFLQVEDADIYGLTTSISVPIRLRTMSEKGRWNWRVTPLAGLGSRFSLDLANGAALWHAGVVHTVDFRISKKLVVSVVNQATTHRSISLPAGDVDYDPQINQQILKNGVRLVTPLSRRVLADVFVVDTRFLKDAAVDQFFTFGASIGLRVTRTMNVTLGVNYDTGDKFKSYSGGLQSAWKW